MGDHDLDGIFVATGPGLKRGERIESAALMDIAPTALYLVGVPIPEDMDGQVLDLFSDQRLRTTPPTYEQDQTAYGVSEYAYTPEEERQVEEQLRSLGYL
jgi:arylsulfatase A-like enzyme